MAVVIQGFKAKPCEECGMEPVSHGVERVSLALDAVFNKVFRPLAFTLKVATPVIDRTINLAGPSIAELLVKTGLALKLNDLDPHSSETALALWGEAEKRGIEIKEIRILGLPRSLFVSRFKGRPFMFQGLPRRPRWQPSLLWLDDKGEMKKRFRKAGFPVAAGGVCATERQALKLFRRLTPPVIAKPHEGSGGRHAKVHINTESELLAAFRNAKQVSPFVIVEEELDGPVFRATLIDQKLAGVLRRDPPQVVGDGRSSIQELVEKENKNPLRRGPVFAEIKLHSATARAELQRQGFTPDTILAPGETAFFHFKVNWGVGGTSRDATEEVHPDNRRLFEDIGAYLREDIVGIDFMIADISRSWKEQDRCGVIELNSLPQLGNHHFPYTGPVLNAAGTVWDMIYPDSRP